MKKIFLFISTMLFHFARAQYVPSDQGSSVVFKISNLGFGITGKFTGLHGRIDFDIQHLPMSVFDISVDAASVNTDNSLRDDHLRGESYFNSSQYPAIHFISTSISRAGREGLFLLTGKLSIKDVVREIQFPFAATVLGEDYFFKGGFKIRRKDFHVGGSSTIADELEVVLDVRARKS